MINIYRIIKRKQHLYNVAKFKEKINNTRIKASPQTTNSRKENAFLINAYV